MAGPFHHDPRQAGQFVPGLATASAGDPDIPKTLPRGITNESLQGGGPTPRRALSFSSPAGTTIDRSESQNVDTLSSQTTLEYPDNQEGIYGPGTPPELASFPGTPVETRPETALAVKEPQSEVATASAPKEPQSAPGPKEPQSKVATAIAPEESQPEVSPVPSQGPSSSGAPSSDPPQEGEGGRKVILEGTMYEDGSYWKILDCK